VARPQATGSLSRTRGMPSSRMENSSMSYRVSGLGGGGSASGGGMGSIVPDRPCVGQARPPWPPVRGWGIRGPVSTLVSDTQSKIFGADYAQAIEDIWHKYQPYAPLSFQKNFQKTTLENYYGLLWEAILGAYFIDNGFDIEPYRSENDNRPDICLSVDGKKIWVECCVPMPGDPNNPNSVQPLLYDGMCHTIQLEPSLLRCTNALKSKKEQYAKWVNDEVCKKNEPLIIAINGVFINMSIYENSLPDMMDILYQKGAGYAVFKRGENGADFGFKIRKAINKKTYNGITEIDTNLFMNKENEQISGIVFSNSWIRRWSNMPEYCYIENIHAKNKNSHFDNIMQTYEYASGNIRMKEGT
jgi:hypothetical protein